MTAEPAPEVTSFATDVPLVLVTRGGFPETVHRGAIVVADTDGRIVASAGGHDMRVFLRSGAKPFQAMPAVMAGAIERFGLTSAETAVLCSSHSGEARHERAVLAVLRKIGLDETFLKCGVHAPISEEAAAERNRLGLRPTSVCNNCSGSHAGMLAACVINGWDVNGYFDPRHPLQREIVRVLAAFADVVVADIETATDNCTVPTFRIPLSAAATAFARLATGRGVDKRLSRAAIVVRNAMTAQPEMVAGEGRFDTDLMLAGHGTLVSKGGADGFQGVGMAAASLGIAVKISDGDGVAAGAAASAAVEACGDTADFGNLQTRSAVRILTATGEQAGERRAIYALEVAG